MKVLVACEYSGIVRDAFIAAGHHAISVDLLPSEGDPANAHWHHTGDIFKYLELLKRTRHSMALENQAVPWFDLMIAHPPCTRLTNSGVRWLAPRNLWAELQEGADFFNKVRALSIKRKCLENPVMHKYARAICGMYDQTFQPWEFGVPQFKRTCLWLDNLPPLVKGPIRTDVPKKSEEPKRHSEWSKVHFASPGAGRAKARSEFFPEVAAAMAAQWGIL